MARVLVLRQSDHARETAAALRARGHEPIVLPVQEIVPLDEPPPGGDFAGFVASSRNAAPALARCFPADERPVFTVGAATGAALAAAGFSRVVVGEGAASLVEPAARLGSAAGKPLLLALGRVRRPVLETGLAAAGVCAAVWETYDTRALHPSRAEIEAALGGRAPDAALLLSAAQARGFARLFRTAPVLRRSPPRLLCLSERIAAELAPELRGRASVSADQTLATLFESLVEPKFRTLERLAGSADERPKKTDTWT